MIGIQAPAYSDIEIVVMRLALAYAALCTAARLANQVPGMTLSHPVGLARAIDLRPLIRAFPVLRAALVVSVVLFVLGWPAPWPAVAVGGLLLAMNTMAASGGAVSHGHHLVTIVAVTHAIGAVAWTVADRFDLDLGSLAGPDRAATAAWWSVQAVLAAYFTSGITKLVRSRGRWVHDSPGVLVNARAQFDIATLGSRKMREGALRARPFVDRLAARPGVTRTILAGGLLVELAAPVGLLGETALAMVGLALLAVHRANGLLLTLPFRLYQVICLAFLVNLPRFLR